MLTRPTVRFRRCGNLVKGCDPASERPAIYVPYDDLDRVTKVVGVDPDGVAGDKIPSESRTFYDAAGNVTMTQSRQKPDPLTALTGTSSLGIFSTTINRYDRLDRLTSTIDANGGVTQSRYDNGGNRIQLTDASFNTTRWQYDAQGQVLSETDGNSAFFTRVLRTLDARTGPEHLSPSCVSLLRLFPSKSFLNLRFLLRFLPCFFGRAVIT